MRPSLAASSNIQRTVDPTKEPVTVADVMQHLRLGPVVDLETLTATDNSDFANTTNPLTVTSAATNYSGLTFTVGRLFRIDNEIFEVASTSGNDVTFNRGLFNTRIESHADDKAIYRGTDQEDAIAELVREAREKAEEYCWSAFLSQTWTLKLDYGFPCEIVVPRPPLISVSSITYVDTNGDSQTLASDQYVVDTHRKPGRVVPAYNVSWPTTRGYVNDVTVTFAAGYGTDADDVPRNIKQAIKLLVSKEWTDDPAKQKLDETAAHRRLDPFSFSVPF